MPEHEPAPFGGGKFVGGVDAESEIPKMRSWENVFAEACTAHRDQILSGRNSAPVNL
ncbi:hypothetical protein [Nonomuraea rubra]|uniref:hypothetical protein n=1 Tax=Nonomuraea rubra TaxID=46180 RepID=UPI0033EBE664